VENSRRCFGKSRVRGPNHPFGDEGGGMMRWVLFSGPLFLFAVTLAVPVALRGDEGAKGTREGVKPFVYPDAKKFEEDREGPQIYHGKYTTPDKPMKVVEWYRQRAGLVGVEGIGFARKQEEGEANSVLDDSRKPGKTERERGEARAVKVLILTKKTKTYLLNVVVSRATDEEVTHLAITYLGLNEK
jgi:hypothetical protein